MAYIYIYESGSVDTKSQPFIFVNPKDNIYPLKISGEQSFFYCTR